MKKMYVTIITLLLIFISILPLQAKQIAVTNTGDSVVLYQDGTWEYLQNKEKQSTSSTFPSSDTHLVPYSSSYSLPDRKKYTEYWTKEQNRLVQNGPTLNNYPLITVLVPLKDGAFFRAASGFESFVNKRHTISDAINDVVETARSFEKSFLEGGINLIGIYVYSSEDYSQESKEIPSDLEDYTFLSLTADQDNWVKPSKIVQASGVFGSDLGVGSEFDGTTLNSFSKQSIVLFQFEEPDFINSIDQDLGLTLEFSHSSNTGKVDLLWPPIRNFSEPPSLIKTIADAAQAKLNGKELVFKQKK